MRILTVTQKVDMNDPVLGFFHRWIEEFSKHCECVTVIALEVGEYDLPKNVKVFSLGKERGISRLGYSINFYRYISRERNSYDAVFVHMNPIYVILGGLLWRVWGKCVGLWYSHRSVDLKLKIASRLVHTIFTPSRESFALHGAHIKEVGHGIPFELFQNPHPKGSISRTHPRIVSVGRITPIKNLHVLIEAAHILHTRGIYPKIVLIGAPTAEGDQAYQEHLHALIREYGLKEDVVFAGSVPNTEVAPYYWESDLSVSLAPLGGVDKAVLESIAAGLPVLVANKAFVRYFGNYADMLVFREGDAQSLADKIAALIDRDDLSVIKETVFTQTKQWASLPELIGRILNLFNSFQK